MTRTFASAPRRPPGRRIIIVHLPPGYQCRSLTTTPPNPPSSSNLRRAAGLSILCFVVAGLTYYVSISEVDPATQFGYTPGKEFEQSIRTSRGVQTYKFTYKTPQEIEQRLHENEEVQDLRLGGGFPVVRWDRNWVGSNEPCEDRSAIDIVRGPGGGKSGKGEIMFASVFDGHSGWATSQLLSQELHPWLKERLLASEAPRQTGVLSWFGPVGSMLEKWLWPVNLPSNEDRTAELLRTL